jgi:DNA-binding LacI/PurR family transcriptional regulator
VFSLPRADHSHRAESKLFYKSETMAVTMKDIAQDLGVSLITVSKVMRNQPDISELTRKRVLDRAKELNYTPNLAARALVTGRTYLVGLVIPDLRQRSGSSSDRAEFPRYLR